MDFVRGNFELKSLTLKNGKCIPTYTYKNSESKEKETREYDVKVPVVPHSDLTDQLLILREYVAKDHYMDTDIDTLERIEITKVLVAGEEKRGIKIVGTLTTLHECNVPIQTGIILFENEEVGDEQELKNIFDAIENEAFEYIFNYKYADATLFNVVDAEEVTSGLNTHKLRKLG